MPRAKPVEVLVAQRPTAQTLPLTLREVEVLDADRIAAEQYGVVARWQLRAAGMSDRAISRRIGRTLHPLFNAVFLVGAQQPLSLPTAGLLAAGSGVLSHHSAAWRWGWTREPLGVVDITVDACRPSRRGLRYHRGRPEVGIVDRLPVTTPARTVLDMAAVLSPRETIALVDTALMSDDLTPAELEAALVPGRRGAGTLRRALDVDASKSRSRAEAHFLRLLRRAGLPTPEVNAKVAGYEFDFVWRRERLIVEYDSWRFHRSPERFVNDRVKQAAAQDAGFRVERIVRRQLYNEAEALIVRIVRALAQTWPSTAPGTPVLVE